MSLNAFIQELEDKFVITKIKNVYKDQNFSIEEANLLNVNLYNIKIYTVLKFQSGV